ncbi:MAG TPA: Wzz/FepE/Etk N-terminal domain-containing protein, partial [Clostridia bacterium]|nr:Wzz/FepE/Etk N-terminal domain-containing protein [Clostridia bacterium]
MDEFTIQDLLNILWKRAVWILCAAILCGGLVGAYYYGFADDQYKAEAVLYVLQTYHDASDQMRVDTSASTFFAADYKVLIQTADIHEKTATEVGLPNVKALNAAVKIDINAVSGTRVLKVSVTGKDPQLCQNVANAASRIFIDVIRNITKTDALALVTEAQLPNIPSGPARLSHTALAFLLGGALCFALLVIMEMLNTRVVSDTQIEKILQQPLLAGVRDYRKEIRHFLTKAGPKVNNLFQVVPIQTQESIRTLATNIQFVERNTPLRTLTLTSATPNEGKSSLSLLVAQEMAQEGLNVLIVDMDFRNPSIGKFLKMR